MTSSTPHDPLRIAVLGVGRIGKMHAELVARQVPGAVLAYVQDVNEIAAKSVGAELGVPFTTDVDVVLSAPDVDAVAICSSTDTHVPLLIAAANAGKAIFCEKPISLDLAAVDQALAVVAASGVPLQIGFNRRFDPAHASVRDAVVSGAVGDVHLVRITSRDPAPPPMGYVATSGGIFLDMTIHDFDMARYIAGSEVVEVFARGAVRVDPAFAEYDDVDTAVITLVHEDGCLTTIDNSRQAVYGYDQRVEAFGSLGMATSENPPANAAVVRTAAGAEGAVLPYFFLERYLPSYVHEWEAFVSAVADGEAPPVGPVDARAPLLIGLAAWRSLREGRPVSVAEIEA
jgi:myo-inositol 2-dehydrogenase/D-chiro-inositol 1-dehydrogenase